MAGIYIHIPFCRQACSYCNFHFSVSLKNKAAVITSLIKEIEISNDFIDDENIETVYVGGGTPSLLNEKDLQEIFDTLRNKYIIKADAEITLEANPDDINKTTLEIWKRMGINRLSVGLQSFNEEELKWMNRAHNAEQSIQCLDEIIEAGYSNYSVDLIYGSPLHTVEDLKKSLKIIAERSVPHVSCYALTVEPDTVLNKKINQKKNSSNRQRKTGRTIFSVIENYGIRRLRTVRNKQFLQAGF